MYLRFRAWATSGWLPAAILVVATGLVVHRYGVRARDIAIFGGYVAFGLAVPGMLWLRLLRGHPAHITEDLTLGLAVGYAVEIATYVAARWIGAPMLFLLWPLSTLALFVAIPGLRRHWRGSGVRAPLAWSWSLVAMSSPVHRLMAFSKFLVEPNLESFRSMRTGKTARLAKRSRTASVSSLDPSSQTTTSSGKRDCARKLSSWASRKRAPL